MPNGVITEIGRKKLCKAHAGDVTLPKITQMAFGSGGVNPSGEVIAPTGAETALKKEILKRKLPAVTLPVWKKKNLQIRAFLSRGCLTRMEIWLRI